MTSPDYDFKDLSPYDFEALIRDLLSANENSPFSTYRVGPDGGIDLKARKDGSLHIAQCKHTPDASRAKLKSLAAKERDKLSKFKDPIQRYIFITSADITPGVEEELRSGFSGCAATVEVHGRGWLNALLALHPELERRHFKLWIKSSLAIKQMLAGGVFLRGQSRARRIQQNYLRFVHHEVCDRADRALESRGVVLIAGSPGAGKTAVAEYLILQWWRRGYRVIVDPRTVDSWWEWLEDDTPTIFFFDDAWGQTRLHDHATSHYDKDFAEFLTTILEKNSTANGAQTRGKVAVVTSRSQVLHDTRRFSDATKMVLEHMPNSVIAVERLTSEVKSRILFNHVNVAVVDERARRELANGDWWSGVSGHQNYSPRIVELVTARRHFTSGRQLINELHEALDDPQQVWQTSFNTFSPLEQLLLSTLAVSDSQGVRRETLTQRLQDYSPTEFGNAIGRLVGTWIERSYTNGYDVLALADPSQRDFLVRLLAREPLVCLDLIKHVCSFEDLKILCERGRAPELEYQPSLFSVEDDSLRTSMDECAQPLLIAMRAMWDRRLEGVDVVPRGVLTFPTDAFVDLFSTFIEMVVYHADRYAAKEVGDFGLDGWFESNIGKLMELLTDTDMGSFHESMDAVEQIYGKFRSLTRYREFSGPWSGHIEVLRGAIREAWGAWDAEALRVFGPSEYWFDLVGVIIESPYLFKDLGFHEAAASIFHLEAFDEEFSSRIEDDPYNSNWMQNLDDLEDLFECSLLESRRVLKNHGSIYEGDPDSLEDEVASPRGIQRNEQVDRKMSTGGIEALFRSLGYPLTDGGGAQGAGG
ncbi:restriction endonuclease [Streptomyces sp. NPDC059008]|uniref:nSTAND3 domain-containing NTPase n=1 Tax=Streptomyces sp. NPDC059008 TaxID=3346693 RepID=UPI00368158B3